MNVDDLLNALQSCSSRICCSCNGFWPFPASGPLNGNWTDAVDAAEEALLATYEQIKHTLGTFDDRTEANIKSLIPAAQRKAREFMKVASTFSLTCRIISGTRTYAEQDELYKIGRTIQKNHPKVTNAKGRAKQP
jgi:peptidoglycan LD-endopeptidase CwlK